MKCKECDYAIKGFFVCEPDKYVCIGVKEPFVIGNPDVECTEYPEYREIKYSATNTGIIVAQKPVKAYVGDDGIYVPDEYNPIYHTMLISRELFVEAYNKWIKNSITSYFAGQDDADDWSED